MPKLYSAIKRLKSTTTLAPGINDTIAAIPRLTTKQNKLTFAGKTIAFS
jgi:hypothetical protein